MTQASNRARHPMHPARLLALGFLGLILLGSIALWLPFSTAPGQATPYLTALFTATSAVCVTGLTVVETATHWSTVGQVIILVLIQMGGLGVMTLSTSIFLLLGLRIRLPQRLALREGLNIESLSGVVRLLVHILAMTIVFEGIGAVLLAIGFWPHYHFQAIFMGIFHSVSAFNNAGFDLTGRSLVPYSHNALVLLVHAFLIIFGGLGYSVILQIISKIRGGRSVRWTLHVRWAIGVTVGLLVAGTVLVAALEWNNPHTLGPMGVGWKILNAFFTSVTSRTAGFNSINTGLMLQPALLVIVLLMFIGASPGGTGGGIKTTTLATMVTGVWTVIRQRHDIEAGERRLSWEFFGRAVAIAMLSLALVMVVSVFILILNHAPLLEAMFETTSAFGTVGLTMGLTPHLTSVSRVLIIMTMYLGRVGPLTAAVALARSGSPSRIRYPETHVPIG